MNILVHTIPVSLYKSWVLNGYTLHGHVCVIPDDMSLLMRKPTICICENKDADQLRGNREAEQRLCFATWIVHFLFFLNPKFQTSSLLR